MRRRLWPRWTRPWLRLENLHFLFEASAQLSASLDLDTTISKIAQLLVPGLADWCLVDTVEGTHVKRLAVVHKDPSLQELAAKLKTEYPVRTNHQEGVGKTLRMGASRLYPEISDELVRKIAYNEEHYQILMALGCHSGMSVPLKMRGEVLGCLTFMISTPTRKYNHFDLLFVEEIGYRVALAIHNARLYREAQETVAIREEFISIASHEMRTPLTNLSLQLQLATRLLQESKEEQPPKIAQATLRMQKAQEQVQKIVSFIDELLDVAKMSNAQWSFSYEALDLCDVVRGAAGQVEWPQNKQQCALLLELPAPVVGQWDKARLEQVINNLLTNAFKYGEGRPVTISVYQKNHKAHLCVQDQGIGISAEEQAKIFQKFTRAPSVNTPDGLGLGLWIVQQIVELLGGVITVQSQPNKGARFEVVLPLEPKPGANSQEG